ncbi:hypothetical protein [Thiobaca trueperi]|uniref:hypothetical protein n=1 Tax=Thiobaca trueperi TaxID=127458 RepID=UPI0010537177|nr:hypothetical protein [Thiobaca trueperi]
MKDMALDRINRIKNNDLKNPFHPVDPVCSMPLQVCVFQESAGRSTLEITRLFVVVVVVEDSQADDNDSATTMIGDGVSEHLRMLH